MSKGLFNMDKVSVTDQERDMRLTVCQSCEYKREERNQWFCSRCNCPALQIKTRYKVARCPIGKW
jgi:uncharacterized paraquat-inducible protein A